MDTGSVKVASNWVVSGGARWDLATNQINQYTVGAGYVDDCFVLALNYVTAYTYAYTHCDTDAQSYGDAADRTADHRHDGDVAERIGRFQRQRLARPVTGALRHG